MFGRLLPAILATTATISPAWADDAEIVAVRLVNEGTKYSAHVTLRHGDTGWDDYADGWRVVTVDGTVLATRVLLHPHVEEQPFTRSKGGIDIPEGLDVIFVEASTNKDSWGHARFEVPVPR